MINFKCSNDDMKLDIQDTFKRAMQVMKSAPNYYVTHIIDYIESTENEINVNILNEAEAVADEHNINENLTTFRAYIIYDIIVFYTRYETVESIVWLIFHEIAHSILRTDLRTFCVFRMVDQVMANEYAKKRIPDHNSTFDKTLDFSKPLYDQEYFKKLYDKTDFHDILLEERICNIFATMIIGKNYNRNWWEKNIRKIEGYGGIGKAPPYV